MSIIVIIVICLWIGIVGFYQTWHHKRINNLELYVNELRQELNRYEKCVERLILKDGEDKNNDGTEDEIIKVAEDGHEYMDIIVGITKHEWEYLNKLVLNGDIIGHYERLLVNGTPIRKGHWIENAPQYDMLNPQYICSECGNVHLRKTPYCEICRSDMR